jgi:hypothetical protein
MKAILEPMMVAAKTHGPTFLETGLGFGMAWMANVWIGCLHIFPRDEGILWSFL